MNFPEKMFVTGTDTDVGKTFVSAMLCAGLEAAYWKPVQSGNEPPTDTQWVRANTGLPDDCFFEETYVLRAPLSPHASAKLEKVSIDINRFALPVPSGERRLIVEGAGGVMVPLNDHHFMLDLMERFRLPVVLVARSTLGTINHTLLSLQAVRSRGLNVFGVVLNGPQNASNKQAIEQYGQVSVLAEIEPVSNVNPQMFRQLFHLKFNPRGQHVDYRHNYQIADMASLHSNENHTTPTQSGAR